MLFLGGIVPSLRDDKYPKSGFTSRDALRQPETFGLTHLPLREFSKRDKGRILAIYSKSWRDTTP
jgi:hypothetical protein